MKKTGYIDSRRLRGGVAELQKVPTVLFPPNMDAFGINEDFESIEGLAAAANLAAGKSVWQYFIVVAATIAQLNLAGGVARMAVPATDENSAQIILGSTAAAGSFFPAAGKDIWFEARVRCGLLPVPATTNYFVGLVTPAAAAILAAAGGALPNDMMGFVKRDQALEINWSFVGRKVAVEDANPLGIVVDNGWHYFGFHVNGTTSVEVYYDRALVPAGALAFANISVGGLMPCIAIRTGDATPAADNIDIDYVMCVESR